MPFNPNKYNDEVQKVSKDTPVEEIIYLLKRDGGVFIKGLISEEDVDQASQEAKPRLDADVEWNGSFFPGESSLSSPSWKLQLIDQHKPNAPHLLSLIARPIPGLKL